MRIKSIPIAANSFPRHPYLFIAAIPKPVKQKVSVLEFAFSCLFEVSKSRKMVISQILLHE
jgi:hypothetical protein